jgi:cytochrome c oxidase subunit 2
MHTTAWQYVAAAVAVCSTAAAIYFYAAPAAAADAPARRIEIEAQKFTFGAKEVRVRKGDRVTIVLTSKDFVHGFSVPDFNVRADAIPGKTIEITFVADKAGKFTFVCDNFCGEDHDKMMGFLVVADRQEEVL